MFLKPDGYQFVLWFQKRIDNFNIWRHSIFLSPRSDCRQTLPVCVKKFVTLFLCKADILYGKLYSTKHPVPITVSSQLKKSVASLLPCPVCALTKSAKLCSNCQPIAVAALCCTVVCTPECSAHYGRDKIPTVKQTGKLQKVEKMAKSKNFCPLYWSFWNLGNGQMSAIIGLIYSISSWSAAKCPL